MNADFTLVDVFSDKPFGGNQLAVFPHAEVLDSQTMQQLAREFNFAESTFVLPPDDPAHTCRVRIFSPRTEMPFAGHPTVGTAAALAGLPGEYPSAERFVFEEGIGPVAVVFDGQDIRLELESPNLQTPPQTPPPSPPAAELARALSLPPTAIIDSWYAGIGLKFCFVHLAGSALVDRAVLDKTAWAAGLADSWSPHLYVFAGDYHDGGSLYARFFAPAFGIDEDPATGSACTTLAACLAQRSAPPDGHYSLRIDQGVALGRPSTLQATARKHHSTLTQATVGGRATIIGHGTISL
jgi:trans-2,3-dihydro-3-hydroxyanthranilate isomerase